MRTLLRVVLVLAMTAAGAFGGAAIGAVTCRDENTACGGQIISGFLLGLIFGLAAGLVVALLLGDRPPRITDAAIEEARAERIARIAAKRERLDEES